VQPEGVKEGGEAFHDQENPNSQDCRRRKNKVLLCSSLGPPTLTNITIIRTCISMLVLPILSKMLE